MIRKLIITLFVLLFTVSFISAESIGEDLHLNIQVIDDSGDVDIGTFAFVFNISTNSDCSIVADVVYSNSTTLTTDSRGIISYYLEDVNLSFSEQYWLCYYRNGTLINNSKIARTPYSFTARNISAEGIINDSNINLVGYNITGSSGLFSWLGSLLNRITELFVQDITFNGSINGSGNITTTGNVTADYFFGDGSELTGVEGTYNSTAWNRSGTDVFLHHTGDSVGIGTGSPTEILQIEGATVAGGDNYIHMRKTDQTAGQGIFIGQTTANNNLRIMQHANNDITFHTTTSDTQRMTILSGGNVGIGTTSPGALLNIQKSTAGVAGTDMHINLWDDDGTTGNRVGITFTGQAVQGRDRAGIWMEVGNSGWDGELVFATRSAADASELQTTDERMRIDKDGNVGIGTTSPTHTLNVDGTMNVTGASVMGNVSFNGGWENDGVSILDGDIYVQTGYFYNITSLNVTKQNLTIIENLTIGGHLFSSGIGNNYFLGNVGIGTTSPTHKLNVVGITNLSGFSITDDSLISMADGSKKQIKDIKAGDYVLSLDEETGEIVSNKVKALLDHGIKPIYEMTTESGRAINTTAEHPYLAEINNREKCERYLSNGFNDDIPKSYTSEDSCLRWTQVSELNEGDYIVVSQNLSSISFGDNTSIGDNFLSTLSPEKIGQSNFNANAKYCISFKCLDNECLACSKQSSNCEIEIKVICSNTNSRASLNSPLDSLDLLKNSSLCFSNSVNKNSGAIKSNLLNIELSLNTSDESPFVSNEESTTLTSTTSSIFNHFKYLFDNDSFILLDNSSTSFSVNFDLETILWNRTALSNLDFINLFINIDQSMLGICLKDSSSSGILILNSSINEGSKGEYLNVSKPDIFFDKIVSIKTHPPEHVYDLAIENTRNFIANDIIAHNTYLGNSSMVVNDSSGNVGIGTINPTHKLNVVGDANITSHVVIGGDLNVSGGDIVLGTQSIFSGGDTASLNNLDAIDATTEATIETQVFDSDGQTILGDWDNTANPWVINEGGTGAATFTDGGILLGSGTEAITAMAVLGDGAIVVGDGTTDPVALSAFTTSTGTLKHESGGLEADVNAYSGLIGINTGSTSEVDTESELETHLGGLDVVTITADDVSSANLATAVSDETGSGALVFATSPTLITPTLGVATATTLDTGSGAGAQELYGRLTDLVAGTGIDGGGNDVLYGPDEDVSLNFDCSEVEGTGINCVGEAITLDATGNWAGTTASWNRSGTNVFLHHTGDSVGIGTANPQARLHIISSGSSSSPMYVNNSLGKYLFRLRETGDSDLEVYGMNASGNTKFMFRSLGHSYFIGGNVGIGTTSPDKLLQVIDTHPGGIEVATVSGAERYRLALTVDSTAAYIDSYKYGTGAGGKSLSLNPNAGNVGIGTSTPGSKLTINANGGTSATSSLNVTNSTGSPLFLVRDDGNVGIGTTSPVASLHVKGTPTSMSKILRPSAAGSEESIASATSGAGNHWQDVNEASPDEDTSKVWTNWGAYQTDQYNLPAFSANGSITKITVYFRCKSEYMVASARPCVNSHYGTAVSISSSGYVTHSEDWIENPSTGGAWTWADIDALQIGVSIKNVFGENIYCTQVYVKITYAELNNLIVDDRVGIGTTDPGFRLQVGETSNYGWVSATGAWATDSDGRLKENIEKIDNALEIVTSLRGVRFNKINDGENQPKQIGFIAQEIETQIPEMVSTGEDGIKGLTYSKITPVLLEAIKELKVENDALKQALCSLHPELELCK